MALKLIDKLIVKLNETIKYNIFECNFGFCFIAKLNSVILKVSILQNKYEIEHEIDSLKLMYPNINLHLDKTLNDNIFEPSKDLNYTIFIKGTAFQKQVWQELIDIPFANTRTYEDIALQLGKTVLASRAIGTAIGSNTIAYLIPCHRVVNKNGKIGEFRWGSGTKKALLKWEMLNKKDSTTLF